MTNFPNCSSANKTLVSLIFNHVLDIMLPSVQTFNTTFNCVVPVSLSSPFGSTLSSSSAAVLTFDVLFISLSYNEGISEALRLKGFLNQTFTNGNFSNFVIQVSQTFGYSGLNNVTYSQFRYSPTTLVQGHAPPKQASAATALTTSSYVGIAFAALFVCILCCGLAYYVYVTRYSEKEKDAPPMLDSNGEVLIDFARAYPGTEGEVHFTEDVDDSMRTSLEGVASDDIRQSIQVNPQSRNSLFGDPNGGSLVGNLMSRMSLLTRNPSSNTSNTIVPSTSSRNVAQPAARPRPISTARPKSVNLHEPPKTSSLSRKRSVNKQLTECTIDDVKSILNYLNMGKYISQFVENGISGNVLHEAESSNDLKECGIAMPGPILRAFYSQIDEFKRTGVPSNVLAPSGPVS